jgi:hypothetical protein
MSSIGLIIQIIAIVIALLAFGLFAKANIAIMKFRQLTPWGLLQLWTGSINTQELIIVEGQKNKVVEKDLVKAIALHKRAKIVVYIALTINIIAFLAGAYQ